MQRLCAFLAIIATSVLLLATPAAGQPVPRPKPAVVYERAEALPAPVTASVKPAMPTETPDIAAMLWEINRLLWLIAAIVLVVAALALWQALQTRDTSRRQLRAYISVRPGAAPQLANDWTDATIIVENSGRTPAFAVDHAITLMMIDYPDLPLDSVMGAADKIFGHKSMILAPGTEMTLPLRTVLSEDEKHETEDGTHKRLCAIGEVRYADAFGKRHFTRFCFMYGGAAIIAGGEMQIAEKGNVAD